jgi:HK97 family phage portal protein
MFLSDGALVTTKTPVDWARGNSWFPYMPPMSTQGWPSAYAGIYSRQLWVYVVVSKRARATARLPLPVYQRDDLNRPRADKHEMSRLLQNPNPGMSAFNLWKWTSATYDIYGDTFWYKRRVRSKVEGLYPLHPSSMSYEDGSWNFDNGRLVLREIPDTDLVRFQDFNPDSLSRGMSPLEPLRSTLENEWAARTATSSFWTNGARPGMALMHKGELSPEAAQRLKAQWDAAAGGAGKTGGTVVLEEGMEPKPLTLTAEEAQYIESRKLNREEVCAAYDVPPPVVHILDRATFSNITEQMRSMYRDTMAPHLNGFEAAIELDLRRAEWPDDDVYAEFLMDEVLRGDFETRQDALAKATHMTLAEKRKVENLPFIEGTDRIFLNTATLPLDAIDAQTAALTASQGGDGEMAEVIPLSVARSILGRLAWQRSLSDVQPLAITEGLGDDVAAVVTKAYAAEVDAAGSVADFRRRLVAMSEES